MLHFYGMKRSTVIITNRLASQQRTRSALSYYLGNAMLHTENFFFLLLSDAKSVISGHLARVRRAAIVCSPLCSARFSFFISACPSCVPRNSQITPHLPFLGLHFFAKRAAKCPSLMPVRTFEP